MNMNMNMSMSMNTVLNEPPPKRKRPRKRQKRCTDLPDDLVIEILCRLPHHKHVFRSMCVSKHWLSLISNPDFARCYITHRLSSPTEQPWAFMYLNIVDKYFRDKKYDTPPTFKFMSSYSDLLEFLPFYQDQDDRNIHEPITIVKAFKDLILCCAEKFDPSECIYYLCNPQTKQWLAIPPTPPPPKNLRCSDVEFICEPYYKIDEHGMVTVNTQFKFKVFRFFHHPSKDRGSLKLQLFSSEIGRWNLTEISLLAHKISRPFTRSFVCNDKLTLIARKRRTHGLSFIYIDINDLCVQRVIDFPVDRLFTNPYRSITYISSCRQGGLRLAQILIKRGRDSPFLLIFELKGNKWNIPSRQVVSFRSMISTDGWISNYYLKERTSFVIRGENGGSQFRMPTILGFHPYNDNLLYLNLNYGNRVGCYNISNNTLTLSSFKEPGPFSSINRNCWCDISQLMLPLWPTPLPQILQAQEH